MRNIGGRRVLQRRRENQARGERNRDQAEDGHGGELVEEGIIGAHCVSV